MLASKLKSLTVAYRFQRFHPALRNNGHGVTAQLNGEQPEPIFFAQSALDSACGLHVISMILAIFGLAKPSALQMMAHRTSGLAAEVWAQYADSYHSGLNPAEMASKFKALDLPVTVTLHESTSTDLAKTAVRKLMPGHLVALAMRYVRQPKRAHWCLAVGVECDMIGSKTVPRSILMLDPGQYDPHYAVFNSRLSLESVDVGRRAIKPTPGRATASNQGVFRHESPAGSSDSVQLIGAVCFRLRP